MQRPQPEQRLSLWRVMTDKSEQPEIRLFPDFIGFGTGLSVGIIAGARGDHGKGRLLAGTSATAAEFVGWFLI
jgi:hypothetical protein